MLNFRRFSRLSEMDPALGLWRLGRGRELADLGKLQWGELLSPSGEQRGGLLGRDAEDEFVILSIRERLFGRAAFAAGQQVLAQHVANLTGNGQAWEVGAKAVAQVHHGGGAEMFSQPLSFCEARGEIEVPSLNGAAEHTGHEQDPLSPRFRAPIQRPPEKANFYQK